MDNKQFWDKRYLELPWFGSGPGSRGSAMVYKKWLLTQITRLNSIKSIVDIGCGDMCWLTQKEHEDFYLQKDINYLGLDISSIIIQKNRKKFPGLAFEEFDICKDIVIPNYDLLICFDVLIHQCQIKEFESAIYNLLKSIRNHSLISYITPTDKPTEVMPPLPPIIYNDIEKEFKQHYMENINKIVSARVENHGDLSTWIARREPDMLVRPIGQYRYQTIYELSRTQWLCLE